MVKLGELVQLSGNPFRVVRIIKGSETLYEGEDEAAYVVTESYAELKGGDGSIEFIALEPAREEPFAGPPCSIRGLEPLRTRR